MTNEIVIKIADLKVAKEPSILTTHGLGSCLAIMLYHPEKKMGGLAHVMLPDPDLSRVKNQPAKFPRTAVEMMLREMENEGCRPERIIAKLAGGATMFSGLLKASRESSHSIGSRNVEEAKAVLALHSVPVVAEDIGGDYGRSVEFILSSGTVLVRSFKAGLKEL